MFYSDAPFGEGDKGGKARRILTVATLPQNDKRENEMLRYAPSE
jgi:hypothetical protein